MSKVTLTPASEYIWLKLLAEIKNPIGVAALMGNLFAESSLNPCCTTRKGKTVFEESYYTQVNDGEISKDAFARDGVAFGIAQWCYWSRKEQLYLFAHECKKGIQDIDVQLDFLLKEIKTYKTVWQALTTSKDIKEASDLVLLRYEKPANTSDKVKELRASYGEQYYNEFILLTTVEDENESLEPITQEEKKPQILMAVTIMEGVNVRYGNGKEYLPMWQTGKAGEAYELIATSTNNWHAIKFISNGKPKVGWIDGNCSRLELR